MTSEQPDAGPDRHQDREQRVDDAVGRPIGGGYGGAGSEVGDLLHGPALLLSRALGVPLSAHLVAVGSVGLGVRRGGGASSGDFRGSPEVVLRANRRLGRPADRVRGTVAATRRLTASTALRRLLLAPRRGILSSPIDRKFVYHAGRAVSFRVAGDALSR